MIFLLNIFFLIFGATLSAPKTTETYSNSLILREPDEFYLYWNYNETDIVIETHAKTSGWSSFGISPTGGMDNSDVVVSWINNDGSHHFSDRHIRGRQVLKDKVQNWFPIAIFQQDDYLITKFTRKIKICDESNEDLDIPEGTPMTIFAYGSVLVDDDIGYHNTNRGTKTVPLINSLNAAPKINLDEVEQVEFRANYTLDKSKDTEYFCTMFKLPADWAKEKRHLIRYETLYTPGTEENLHHWTVNECGPDFEKEFLKSNSIPDPAFCYSPNWIKALSYCRKISLAWAVGGSIIQDFPEDLAYPLGGSDQETKYFFLEIHYDNPRLKNGVKDYSGVRFYATKNYRKNEFGVFTVGAEESAQGIILPPRAESFKLNYACSRDCTDMLFEQQDEIKVFSTLPHAHLLGKEIYTKVIRDGKEVAYLANNKFYDFNNQYYNFLNKPVTLKKGDEIVTKCVYGTNKKANFTYGGLATYNEMCLNFIWYYPKSTAPVSMCVEAFNQSLIVDFLNGLNKSNEIEVKNLSVETFEKRLNPELRVKNPSKELIQKFEDFHNKNERNQICIMNGNFKLTLNKPTKAEPIADDSCPKNIPTTLPPATLSTRQTTSKKVASLSESLLSSSNNLKISFKICFFSLFLLKFTF